MNGFKNKIMNMSNLTKYFIYFLSFSVFIIVILGISLYYYSSRILINEAIDANRTMLTQLKNSQEVVLSEVESSILKILFDPFLQSYEKYYNEKDMIAIRDAQSRLDSILTTSKNIHSIYIYYPASNYILSNMSPYIPYDEFYDKEYLEKIINNKNYEWMSFENRYITDSTNSTKDEVISFVNFIPIISIGSPKAVIVINLHSQYLHEIINSINIKKNSKVMIFGEGSEIIAEKNNISNLIVDNVNNFNISFNSKTKDFEIRKIGGQKFLISYSYSNKYKLRYAYIIPTSSYTNNIKSVGIVIVLICLSMMFLGSLISFFLSKKVYSPLRLILKLLQYKRNESYEDIKDIQYFHETDYIERNINILIDNNTNLNRLNKALEEVAGEYKNYQKNLFLKTVIEGSCTFFDQSINERLAYYEINLDVMGIFVVCTVTMDRYYDFIHKYSEEQKNKWVVYNVENITNLIVNQYKGFVVEVNTNKLAVVINLSNELSRENAEEIALKFAQDIQMDILDSTVFTHTIGISSIHNSISEVIKCYEESITAINQRLLLGYGHIISYKEIKGNDNENTIYPYYIESEILDCLKTGDKKGVFRFLEDFIAYIMEKPKDDTEMIHYYFLQLLTAAEKCLYEMDRKGYLNIVLNNVAYTALLHKETILDITVYIRDMFNQIMDYFEEQRNNKNKELIEFIILYMIENIKSNLSIEKIAEQFYISASHLRRIFKEETGITIKDYFDNERMNIAKELLKNPKAKIGEIAESVGYSSLQTFSRAFKQQTGKTPGEYRIKYLPELDK